LNACFFQSQFFQHDADALSGLMLKDVPDKNVPLLNCCKGSGCLFRQDSGIFRCDLDKRFLSATKIIHQYKSETGLNLQRTLTKKQNSFVMEWFKDRKTGFALKHPQKGPSALWEIALIAAWRESLRVRIISFKNFKDADLYNADTDLDILFVDEVDKLWLPEKSLELSLLIDFSFARCIPLWISLVPAKDERSKEERAKGTEAKDGIVKDGTANDGTAKAPLDRMQKLYRKKLSQIKHQRTPLEWLPLDSLGKLKEQTSGWQAFE